MEQTANAQTGGKQSELIHEIKSRNKYPHCIACSKDKINEFKNLIADKIPDKPIYIFDSEKSKVPDNFKGIVLRCWWPNGAIEFEDNLLSTTLQITKKPSHIKKVLLNWGVTFEKSVEDFFRTMSEFSLVRKDVTPKGKLALVEANEVGLLLYGKQYPDLRVKVIAELNADVDIIRRKNETRD